MEQKTTKVRKVGAFFLGMLVVMLLYVVVGGSITGFLHWYGGTPQTDPIDFGAIGNSMRTVIGIYVWVRVYRYYVKKWAKAETP